MIWGGIEATGGGNELAGMEHALEGFTGAFIGVESALGHGPGVQRDGAVAQDGVEVVTLEGEELLVLLVGGGEGLLVLLVEPVDGGEALFLGEEFVKKRDGLGTEGVRGGEQVMLGGVRVGGE